jgi:hypothetical protein
MNDAGKYIRLFWILFLAMTGFLIVLILLFLGLRLVMGLVNELPWISYIYTLFILSVPAAIFITAFSIYSYRTRSHPSGPVRIISYLLFGIFLCAWLVFYTMDIITFFRTSQTVIEPYKSWNLIFLSANVACLFIVGIIQALSSAKEEDWLERNKREHPDY